MAQIFQSRMITIPVKPKNSANPQQTGNTKSQVSVAEIAFGSTISAKFFTGLSILLLIISICDLAWTLLNYTPDWWDPKITGILGVTFSTIISGSLMLMSYRKMNATVVPSNVV